MVLGLEIVYHKKATKEQPIQRIRKIGTRLVRSDVYTVITTGVQSGLQTCGMAVCILQLHES